MFDLNQEEAQREYARGTVPAGSKIFCRVTVEKPQYSSADDDYVAETKSGLLGLFCKIEVVSGEYEGVRWYENLWLPTGMQKIQLTEGQTIACNRTGSIMRAIVEAARGVMPKAADDRSCRARRISAWTDIDGMEFPCVVGIGKNPFTARDGREYWNNVISRVITPDKKEYAEVKSGKEVITDGPTKGDPGDGKSNGYGQTQGRIPNDDFYGRVNDDPGPAFPSEPAGMDVVPF
ncbi:MAG: hypothetical protein LBQ10_01260 [Desulfovibrio sp.]|jgi:hypothetical protein|nr:hypothetical protein [Desulfovibrio sp.]